MLKNKNKNAFTLVELIIVVTILAILATIAFISFQGYTGNARNSNRLSNVTNIKKTLELYSIKTQEYPLPDSYKQITWSGATAWIQGIIGEGARKGLKELQSLPLDPLLKSPYTYSVTTNKKEYELGYALEGSVAYNDSSLLSKTYANTSNLLGYTDGDYNGVVLKVSTGSIDYYLAVPSIISADISKARLIDLTGSLVFNGKKNIPGNTALLGLGNISTDPDVLFNPKNTGDFVVYSTGTGNIPDTEVFVNNLKNIYTGSVLENVGDQKLIEKVTEINVGNISTILKSAGINIKNIQTNNNNEDSNAIYIWTEEIAPSSNSPLGYTKGDHGWLNGYSPIDCDKNHIGWKYGIGAGICDGEAIDGNNCKDDIGNVDDLKRVVKNNDTGEFLTGTYDDKPIYYLYTCTKVIGDDITPPIGGSFSINNSASIANSTKVILDVTFPKDDRSNINQLQVAYGDTPNPTNWMSPSKIIQYSLSDGDGDKTIYMRFKDNVGNISTDIVRSINLNSSCDYDVIKLNGYDQNKTITINKACGPIILNLIAYEDGITNIINNSGKNIVKINYLSYEGTINFNVAPTNGITKMLYNGSEELSDCPSSGWDQWSTYGICHTTFDNFFYSNSLNKNGNRPWIYQYRGNITID